MSAPSEFDPATLNREIARLETDVARLDLERAALAKMAARLTRRHRYLRLARWFRAPTASFAHYPLAVFAIGPLVIGVLVFVLLSLLFNNWSLASAGLLVGIFGSAVMFAKLLYSPADSRLVAATNEVESKLSVEQSRLQDASDRSALVNDRLQKMLEARRQLAASGKLQRAMLLQRNWKAMRDDEWEDYLVEVCRTLGAKVQRTGRVGDQGVDLIVEFGSRRVAVQAKGYYHAVNSKAVQEAVAGVAHYGCNAAAVITNSRFTKGAQELAASNRCALIGEEEFPDFVLGKLTL